jgi:hypothetical protein
MMSVRMLALAVVPVISSESIVVACGSPCAAF